MKYLLVLVVVFVAVWMWRNNRVADQQNRTDDKKRETTRASTQQTMVACAHCGLHLPQTEALAAPSQLSGQEAAPQNWFCSAEHRQLGAKLGQKLGEKVG